MEAGAGFLWFGSGHLEAGYGLLVKVCIDDFCRIEIISMPVTHRQKMLISTLALFSGFVYGSLLAPKGDKVL